MKGRGQGRQRPQDTLQQLCDVFPPFKAVWDEEGAPSQDGLVDGIYYQWTHHAVMRAFLAYFAVNHTSFTEKQLGRFGEWVNQAVSVDDDRTIARFSSDVYEPTELVV